MKKYFIYRIVLLATFIFLVSGCGYYERGMCIYGDDFNKEDLKLSFIPEEDCYGYVFNQDKSIAYQSVNAGKAGKMRVVLEDDHESWLSGHKIILSEERPGFDQHNHFSNLKKFYGKQRDKIFDDYLGLEGYDQIDSKSDAKIRHLFDVSEATTLPLYVSCVYWPKNESLTGVRCGVQFAYNSAISVYLTVDYLDLKNAKSKAAEIQSFIRDLIVLQP